LKNPDLLAATKPVAEAFEKLGITYCIGGSVASSAYGIPRSTMDDDRVSDKSLDKPEPNDEAWINEAVARREAYLRGEAKLIPVEKVFDKLN
jgi:hypothetical protein